MTSWTTDTRKRIFDASLASLLLVGCSGPIAVLALLVKASSAGPAFYPSRRVGRHGRVFRMYKLRSMVADADRRGPLITEAGDPRVTPLGRWLRRTKADELPALWNVIKGEMSLVGPRPENPESVGRYTTDQRRVLTVRPGLTSRASIEYRNEEQILGQRSEYSIDARYHEIMQAKLQLDLEYIEHASLRTDLAILLQTAAALLRLPRVAPPQAHAVGIAGPLRSSQQHS